MGGVVAGKVATEVFDQFNFPQGPMDNILQMASEAIETGWDTYNNIGNFSDGFTSI